MMRLCPKCGAEAADSCDTCHVCGTAVAGVESAGCLPELPIMATLVESPLRPKPLPAPVGVPRRFSIGTMMILTTAFAVLFGVLKTFGVPPIAFAAISIFIGGVGACQSLLFKGKRPRLASFVGGIIMFGLLAVVGLLVACFVDRPLLSLFYIMILMGVTTVLTAVIGGPLGYIVGCLVAAIFLVRKEPDDAEPTPEKSDVPLLSGDPPGDAQKLDL